MREIELLGKKKVIEIESSFLFRIKDPPFDVENNSKAVEKAKRWVPNGVHIDESEAEKNIQNLILNLYLHPCHLATIIWERLLEDHDIMKITKMIYSFPKLWEGHFIAILALEAFKREIPTLKDFDDQNFKYFKTKEEMKEFQEIEEN